MTSHNETFGQSIAICLYFANPLNWPTHSKYHGNVFLRESKKKKKKRYKPDKITYMFFSLFKFLDIQITVTFCKRGFSWTKNHSTVGSVDVWYLSEML